MKNGSCSNRSVRVNHGKQSKEYGTLCGRPKRFLAENGRVRYGHGGRVNSDTLLY
jgi:hypothetical protein